MSLDSLNLKFHTLVEDGPGTERSDVPFALRHIPGVASINVKCQTVVIEMFVFTIQSFSVNSVLIKTNMLYNSVNIDFNVYMLYIVTNIYDQYNLPIIKTDFTSNNI